MSEVASVLMRAIAERGAAAAAPLRDAALREAALLRHLRLALFSPAGPTSRLSRCMASLLGR